MIKESDIIFILEKYNVKIEKINNINIYSEAFNHPSKQQENNDYERLEFLGDVVFKLILSNYLYERYEDANEGFLTKLKIKIENKKSLSNLNKILGINKHLIMSENLNMNDGKNNNKILEDSFESFIGALYIDLDFEICKKFVYALLNSEINFANLIYYDDNYKDQILRYYHEQKWNSPKYKLLESENKMFVIAILDNDGNEFEYGKGKTKKYAEQMASKNALLKLNVISH